MGLPVDRNGVRAHGPTFSCLGLVAQRCTNSPRQARPASAGCAQTLRPARALFDFLRPSEFTTTAMHADVRAGQTLTRPGNRHGHVSVTGRERMLACLWA